MGETASRPRLTVTRRGDSWPNVGTAKMSVPDSWPWAYSRVSPSGWEKAGEVLTEPRGAVSVRDAFPALPISRITIRVPSSVCTA